MSKNLARNFTKVKLFVEPGKANPAPPIGTTLGPRGINIMNFCKQFNEEAKSYRSLKG